MTAVDRRERAEAAIVGDPGASEAELKRLARQKLDYVLAKGAGDEAPRRRQEQRRRNPAPSTIQDGRTPSSVEKFAVEHAQDRHAAHPATNKPPRRAPVSARGGQPERRELPQRHRRPRGVQRSRTRQPISQR